jgi:DNA-binding transcriptional LysR family regulator
LDKWTEMHVFVEAVKRGGFSAAGRQLNLSPSAISKLVSRLENRLGVRLFNRTTRTLHLTEAGQAFFKRCIEILEDVEDAETSIIGFGHVPKGVLRINSTPGFFKHQLLPIMAEFQQLYPQLVLEFQLTGQSIDLINEGVDLAIRLGVLKDTSLVARKLGESNRVICASPQYIKTHGIPLKPQDLLHHNCLRLSTNDVFNRWEFYSKNEEEIIEVDGQFVTDNVEALYEYALLGGGIVRLSGFMVGEAIKAGSLVPILKDYSIKKQQIHAVFPHRKHLPAKVRVLLDFLFDRFSKNTPWD